MSQIEQAQRSRSDAQTSMPVPLPVTAWKPVVDEALRDASVRALEAGNVVVFPDLAFGLTEQERSYLRPDAVKEGTKTIKFELQTGRVWGTADQAGEEVLRGMLRRYAEQAHALVLALFPGYEKALRLGATSFRPVEAQGREQSKRHDDTLLHVDAFPSRPSAGQRILRVFTNIHPGGKPRVWRVGEPFESVAKRFLPKIGAPLPGSAQLMKLVGLTKALRTAADHYMLKLHDAMKFDEAYQRDCPKLTVEFQPGTTWMVFTDQVSHSAISGQHALEQTFTLDLHGMSDPETSPLRVLERLKGKTLH
jgi:hypothetical protein